MICKMSKGGGFRGLLQYLVDGKAGKPRVPPGQLIGGNLSGRTPRDLAAELAAVCQLRPDVRRPVVHSSLALRPGESLNDQQWREAGRVWLKEMGFDPQKHPFAIYKHDDREHLHIHIVASRIGVDGSLARECRGDYKRAHAAAAKAARAVGMEPAPVPAASSRQPRVTKKDRQELDRGAMPARLEIAAKLDKAASGAADWEDFKTKAAQLGLEIAEVTNSGGIYGVKYRVASEEGAPWLKGSQVGKAYSYFSILRRLQASGADLGTGNSKPRQDLLKRLQVEKTAVGMVYRWANGAVAVIDTGVGLQWRSGSANEAAALAAVAQSKGWTSVQLGLRSTPAAADVAWLEYMKRGVAVLNHTPSKDTYAEYINWRDGFQPEARRDDCLRQETSGDGSRNRSPDPTPSKAGGARDRNDQNQQITQPGSGLFGIEAEKARKAKEEAEFSSQVAQLNSSDERAMRTALFSLIERWTQPCTRRAKEEIRQQLPGQIKQLLDAEQDETRRRRLLAQLLANMQPERPPGSLEEAKRLLARTPDPGSLSLALEKIRQQHRRPTPSPTPPQPQPGI